MVKRPSGGKKQNYYNTYRRTADHTSNVMSAVLLSASRISSYQQVRKSGPRYLRDICKQDYMTAVKKLEEAKIGHVWVSDKARVFFVKKPPDQVKNILLENKFIHLCTIEEYDERYHLPIPYHAAPNTAMLKKMDA